MTDIFLKGETYFGLCVLNLLGSFLRGLILVTIIGIYG